MEIAKPECAKCGIKNKICTSPEGQGPAFLPNPPSEGIDRKDQ